MSKSVGVGSASLILVFTVLCLTIFSLLTYASADADQALADASLQMLTHYYAADTLAEQILADILEADDIPERIHDVDIITEWDWITGYSHIMYACPVSDTQALYVDVAVSPDAYDILVWEVRNKEENPWEDGNALPVWEGF